jgi:hypothetical protein
VSGGSGGGRSALSSIEYALAAWAALGLASISELFVWQLLPAPVPFLPLAPAEVGSALALAVGLASVHWLFFTRQHGARRLYFETLLIAVITSAAILVGPMVGYAGLLATYSGHFFGKESFATTIGMPAGFGLAVRFHRRQFEGVLLALPIVTLQLAVASLSWCVLVANLPPQVPASSIPASPLVNYLVARTTWALGVTVFLPCAGWCVPKVCVALGVHTRTESDEFGR